MTSGILNISIWVLSDKFRCFVLFSLRLILNTSWLLHSGRRQWGFGFRYDVISGININHRIKGGLSVKISGIFLLTMFQELLIFCIILKSYWDIIRVPRENLILGIIKCVVWLKEFMRLPCLWYFMSLLPIICIVPFIYYWLIL